MQSASLVAERDISEFFESVAKNRDAKVACNWITSDLFGALNKAGKDISETPISAKQLGELIDLIKAGGTQRQQAIASIYRNKKLKNQILNFVSGDQMATISGRE